MILTSVGLHVFVKVLLHVEVLAAPLAHELIVPNVDSHVRAELVLVLEPLVAVLHWTQGMVLDAKHSPAYRFIFILKTQAAYGSCLDLLCSHS